VPEIVGVDPRHRGLGAVGAEFARRHHACRGGRRRAVAATHGAG
jgi:hypothetical protein